MLSANMKLDLGFVDDLQKELKKAQGVKSGYFDGMTYPDGTPISEVALYNEFGTDKIPPRPFLRKSFKDLDKWKAHVDEWISQGVDFEVICSRLGGLMRESIVDSIKSNIKPENAPSTIKAKGSDGTLRDTGLMMSSTAYEVIK